MIIKPKFKLIKNTREGYDKKEISISKNFKNCELNITVAEILIKYVISNRDNPVITYKELALKISQDFNPRCLSPFLGNISNECKENGLPYISGIVVNKNTGLPGEGFYKEFYQERSCGEWEKINQKCKSDIINCTLWQDFLDAIIK